jgi:hypothetical protein
VFTVAPVEGVNVPIPNGSSAPVLPLAQAVLDGVEGTNGVDPNISAPKHNCYLLICSQLAMQAHVTVHVCANTNTIFPTKEKIAYQRALR